MGETLDPVLLLEEIIPFQFLSDARRAELAERLELRRYADGEQLMRQGETSRDVFLLARGSVDRFDEHLNPPELIDSIEAGHYVGEHAALLERPRALTVRAHGEVQAYTLPGKDFLTLVEEVPVFAQALANILRGKQGIFQAYQRLYARLMALLDRGEFLLSELVPAYCGLQPALHPHLDADRIDVDALSYAVARLPAELTRTSFYYLTGTLSPRYKQPEGKFDPVPTKARRRSCWRPLPGKLIVLLRDGISDVTDLLTCLCLYVIEARKIRHRVWTDENLVALKELAEQPDPERARALIDAMDFSDHERAGLRRIWPEDLATRLRDIALHHEDIAFECDITLGNYNSSASEIWVRQIRSRAKTLVDISDPELRVHIISSNTHSVANCLSPYMGRRREEILAWGRTHMPELCGEPSEARPWGAGWAERDDLVYAIGRHYLHQSEDERDAARSEQLEGGRHRLKFTAFTGIEVDLFDLSKLQPELADGGVGARRPSKPTLIVNIDYAFGQQAEQLLANLLFVFGHRVRSLNVIGKAGGLTGRRGDLLLASATLLQTNDELYPLPNGDLPAELLQSLAPAGRAVHVGPVLTVAGTLLQDRTLLNLYERTWKCVGLEMEGSFFARQLLSTMATGVVRPDLRTRFAYYVSDVPLEPEANLSDGLSPWEGIPPLYAVTRAILRQIFAAEDE